MLDDWQLRLPIPSTSPCDELLDGLGLGRFSPSDRALNNAYPCRELIRIRAMALNDTGNPKNRDPADIVLTAVALVIMVSFFGTIWWYVM